MDGVLKHVQTMRGHLDIQSAAGRSTTFFIKSPLTLVIIAGLVVVVGENCCILPIFSVTELFRPEPSALSMRVVVESQGKSFCLFVDDLAGAGGCDQEYGARASRMCVEWQMRHPGLKGWV
jgi:hypothetical protein